MFTTDCRIGSGCFKPAGSLQGNCTGGDFSGNGDDRRPARNPLDLAEAQGDTCASDLPSGNGGKCIKIGGRNMGPDL